MIYYVGVTVALERPPTGQGYREYTVEAKGTTEALIAALQMASCTSVMPVEAAILGDVDFPPDYISARERPQ